ncbi:MAG: IS3 family transposase [Syntrophales bacterium]|nr:IS3 family transposase [Syntrophales bacterium]
MIDKGDALAVTRQCALLDLCRSSLYYKPVALSAKDLELMRRIDEIHLAFPFYGSRKIRNELWAKGYDVGGDRVRRLMRRMGIEALYIKPRLSASHRGHRKYPCVCCGARDPAPPRSSMPLSKGYSVTASVSRPSTSKTLSRKPSAGRPKRALPSRRPLPWSGR